MYTLIKKICKLALMIGIALIICGVISGAMLADFEKNAVETVAYITTIEEAGALDNGDYKVNLRYTVDGKRYDGTITSGNLGESFRKLEAEAEAAGMDVIDYVDNVQSSQKIIPVCYNKEVPKSVKYVDYQNDGNDFYKWGIIASVGSLVVLVINSVLKKKREERAAEKRLEKKMAKQAKQQGK